VPKVLKVKLALKVFKDYKVFKAQPALLGHKVYRDYKEFKD
jgi:hypothetical protein